MNLKTEIEFYVKGPLVSNKVRNIYDLQTIVQTCDLTEPRHLKLVCYADIINVDKNQQKKSTLLELIAPATGKKEVASLDFIATNKITTVADIRLFLTNKYGTTFNFIHDENTEKKPAILDGVHENTCTGLRDSQTGQATHYSLHSVLWHYLNNHEIVVDNDLKQIWPRSTGKIPVAIQKFFHVNVR